jgi:hypothetical protein
MASGSSPIFGTIEMLACIILAVLGIFVFGSMVYLFVREVDMCKEYEEYLALKGKMSDVEYQTSVASSINLLKNKNENSN